MTDPIYANSAVSAHMAKHMLNKARIAALIRAGTPALADTILGEMEYVSTDNSIDQIIEAARNSALDYFTVHCTDPALTACVTAMYNFTQTKQELSAGEKALFLTLEQQSKKIKDKNVRRFFERLTDAYATGNKISEEVLWQKVFAMRTDTENCGFIFYWYMLKQSELAAVKTILIGKKLGFSREKISTNLGGLYERF